MTERTRLTTHEAAPLLHALCARAAEEIGVRALAIKGPIVAMQGLRAPRASADIDILVHPDDLQSLVARLLQLGWHESPEYTGPRIVAHHSTDLLHQHWSLGIDVHSFFPGFLADPAAVFDLLWKRKVDIELAEVPVPTCDPVTHTVVVALHLLRYAPDGETSRLNDLVRRARRVLGDEGIAELVDFARITSSDWPLRPFLHQLGVGVDALTPRQPSGYAAWKASGQAPPAMAWVLHLAALPKRQWPRALWKAVMLPEDQLRSYYGISGEHESVARLRMRRVSRGVRRFPRALWAFVRSPAQTRVTHGSDDDRPPEPRPV